MRNVIFFLTFISLLSYNHAFAQKASSGDSKTQNRIVLKIKPSSTDASISAADDPHLVMYDTSKQQEKLFLFLPGTNGVPERGPMDLFLTALDQGHRVINLAYINKQAVAAICRGENLANDIDCTEKFRTKRVFGEETTTLIPDEPQDAIINRLTKLLVYLEGFDKQGNWGVYLESGVPKWDQIIVTGQSQGGGMAAFIAKRLLVSKIVTFSGGWDYSEKDKIAGWYSKESITPADRWYGTYHVEEPKASTIADTYKAMAIPDNHIYPLDLKVREGKRAHGEAIRNTVYKQLWLELLSN